MIDGYVFKKEEPMNKESYRRLAESYHEAINHRDVNAFDEIFAKDFINYAAGFDPISGCDAMKSAIHLLLDAFPDLHIAIDDIIIEDNKMSVRWSLTGTHTQTYKDIPPSNIKIKAEGIYIDHMENEKITKRWACNNFDKIFTMLRSHAREAVKK